MKSQLCAKIKSHHTTRHYDPHTKGQNSIQNYYRKTGWVGTPPYILYKATNLYDTWTFGGPAGARYNRSKSGWFDLTCFSDWFNKIIIPYIKKLTGRKVLIGDNLSSHLSEDVIAACEKYDIAFVFFPPNSTHLCQPLDFFFFWPMKAAWRPIVEKWKKGPGRKQSTIPKDC